MLEKQRIIAERLQSIAGGEEPKIVMSTESEFSSPEQSGQQEAPQDLADPDVGQDQEEENGLGEDENEENGVRTVPYLRLQTN